MPKRFIDVFEIVEIEVEDGEWFSLLFRRAESLL